jgi:hypothetical protein
VRVCVRACVRCGRARGSARTAGGTPHWRPCTPGQPHLSLSMSATRGQCPSGAAWPSTPVSMLSV